jgi:hypothetical protein
MQHMNIVFSKKNFKYMDLTRKEGQNKEV